MWALPDQFKTNLRCIIGDVIALLRIVLHLHSTSFTHIGDPACEHLFVLHCIALPCILHAWHCIACPGSAAQAVRPLQYIYIYEYIYRHTCNGGKQLKKDVGGSK